MLKLDPFAREVSFQQDLGLRGDAVRQRLDDKTDDGSLSTERVSERRGEGSGDSRFAARELSIFIDNDWFVFATLSRDLVCNIAADAKDTALKFEIPSNVQDTCDSIFCSKACVDHLLSMRVKITLHVFARLCAEFEKNVSKKFGCIVSETCVDVETLVFQQKDLWITLWMECHGRQRQRERYLEQRPPSRSITGYQGTLHNNVAGYARTTKQLQTLGHR